MHFKDVRSCFWQYAEISENLEQKAEYNKVKEKCPGQELSLKSLI